MTGAITIFKKFMERFKRTARQTAGNEFDKIMNYLNLIGYPVGLELTDDWEMSSRGVCAYVVSLFYLSWSFYTLYVLMPSIIGTLVIGGILLEICVAFKFLSSYWNIRKRHASLKFISSVYSRNSSGTKNLILLDWTKTMNFHFKLVCAGIWFGFLFYAFYPFYDLVVNGNLTKVSPLVLPFADETTVRGYVILLLLNVLPLGYQVFGDVSISFLFFIHVDGYASLVEILEEDFKTFDAMWETKKGSAMQREMAFRNLMTEITDIARFSEYINKLYKLVSTVQIGTCYLATAIVLFAFLAVNYISGLGAAAYFMTQLMTFCYIGQLMENTTRRLEEVIYKAKWYLYDVKYQRDMCFALILIQGVKPIFVGGVLTLNFKTGLAIVKNIYTMTMFFAGVIE